MCSNQGCKSEFAVFSIFVACYAACRQYCRSLSSLSNLLGFPATQRAVLWTQTLTSMVKDSWSHSRHRKMWKGYHVRWWRKALQSCFATICPCIFRHFTWFSLSRHRTPQNGLVSSGMQYVLTTGAKLYGRITFVCKSWSHRRWKLANSCTTTWVQADHIRLQKPKSQKMKVSKQLH